MPFLAALLTGVALLLPSLRAPGAARRLDSAPPIRWVVLALAVQRRVLAQRPGQRNRAERASATAVVELAQAWAAELRAGLGGGPAMVRAAAEVLDRPVACALAPVMSAIDLGADPVAAMTRAAALPGCGLLRSLGAAWFLGAERGSALADAVDRLAAAGRSELDHRAEIGAQLAGPRATAWLLACLPAFGWILGAALGANPLGFLFGTVAGMGVAVTGVGLAAAGLFWTAALARAAEDPP